MCKNASHLQHTTNISLELGHSVRYRDVFFQNPRKVPLDNEATHDWEFYLKDRENERMHYVEKVVIKLHDTFHHPRRGT